MTTPRAKTPLAGSARLAAAAVVAVWLHVAPAAVAAEATPALAGSVVFYHSFSVSPDRAEINRLNAPLAGAKDGKIAPGLTGNGYRSADRKASLGLRKLAWPLHKPITASLWWRLEKPMADETSFHLVSLRAGGYLSHFVRGKGQWCALKRPTFVIQMYNFAGISNVNGIGYGHAWTTAHQWHHAAVTVAAGSTVRVYWDGRLRSEFTPKGRLFGAADVVNAIDLGNNWLSCPMTIDEVLLLDRALSAREVSAYVTAVRKLAEVGFVFRQ